MKSWQIVAVLALATTGVSIALVTQAAPSKPVTDGKVQVVFSGGHETEGRDRGRPVVLIAGALGVPAEVFREAFSGVRPAHGRGPTEEEARANKDALLRVLGPYGITNERLDEVSNYYRYRREAGEMWPTEDAVAYAILKHGKITGFEVTSGGSGYSSTPRIELPGTPALDASVNLALSK
ncbi:hypothetical protein EON80_28195, partial [bacterium]